MENVCIITGILLPFEKYNSPYSPFVKLRNLPLKERISILTKIYEFATFVEAKGFVMVDFYDGSILYDFKNGEFYICDIDFLVNHQLLMILERIFGVQRVIKHLKNIN